MIALIILGLILYLVVKLVLELTGYYYYPYYYPHIDYSALRTLVAILFVVKIAIQVYRNLDKEYNTKATLIAAWRGMLGQLNRSTFRPVKWLRITLDWFGTSLENSLAFLSAVDEAITKLLKQAFELIKAVAKKAYAVSQTAYDILGTLITGVLKVGQGLLYLFALTLAIAALLLYVFSPLLMYNLTNNCGADNSCYEIMPNVLIALPPQARITEVAPRFDSTTVTLLLVVVGIGLFTWVSDIKILDVLEIKRNLSQFKQSVDEKLEGLSNTVQAMSLMSVRSDVRSSQQTVAQNDISINIDKLQQRVKRSRRALGLLPDDVQRVRRDLPTPATPIERTLSLFKLRFLVEEKLKNIASLKRIPFDETCATAELNETLRNGGLLYPDLASSIDNIARITDQVANGIQLTPEQTDLILTNGASVLAALDMIQFKIQTSLDKNATRTTAQD